MHRPYCFEGVRRRTTVVTVAGNAAQLTLTDLVPVHISLSYETETHALQKMHTCFGSYVAER